MIAWLNENSGSVQGLATIVLVLITGVYAFLTRSIAKSGATQADAMMRSVSASLEQVALTQQLVHSALSQADATKSLASEASRTRGLSYFPVLLPRFAGSSGNTMKVEITNQGVGPALAVRSYWVMREADSVVAGDFPESVSSMAPGASLVREVSLSDPEAVSILSRLGGVAVGHYCRYTDIKGAEFESRMFNGVFELVGINPAARFLLDNPPSEP